VAKVIAVDRKIDTGFAKVMLAPAAPPDGVRHVLVLEPLGLQLPPKPEPDPPPDRKAAAKKAVKK
jgi:rod shape-determining protein MreC